MHTCRILKTALVSLTTVLFVTSFGQFAGAADNRIFSVGVGAATTILTDSTEHNIEVYIRVESDFCKRLGEDFCLVVARGFAAGSSRSSEISTIDIDYDVLGGEFELNKERSAVIGASLFNVSFQRSVPINQDKFLRLSVAGFRFRGNVAPSENVEIFAKIAVDLLSLAYMQNVSQSRMPGGMAQAVGGEVGIKLYKQVTMSVSERFAIMNGWQTIQEPSDQSTCVLTNQADSSVVRTCSSGYKTIPRDQGILSITRAAITVDLFRYLSIFGSGNYNYYHSIDELGGLPDDVGTTPNAAPVVSQRYDQERGVFQLQIGIQGSF